MNLWLLSHLIIIYFYFYTATHRTDLLKKHNIHVFSKGQRWGLKVEGKKYLLCMYFFPSNNYISINLFLVSLGFTLQDLKFLEINNLTVSGRVNYAKVLAICDV